VRATRLQELIRQWILFIPLLTAVSGAIAVQTLPPRDLDNVLPPLFLAAGLLVTASMLYLRQLATLNLKLAEGLHGATTRLNLLHHLSLELDKSLDAAQIAGTLLEHTRQLLAADAAALWLLSEYAAPPATRSQQQGLLAETESAVESRWRRMATLGFESPAQEQALWQWEMTLESGAYAGNGSTPLVAGTAGEGALPDSLNEKMPDAFGSAIALPILWKGNTGGVILVSSLHKELASDDLSFLNNITLIAAPAFSNALLYQSATTRAEIDGLTNLYNHRAIQERLVQEVARARRSQKLNPDARLAMAIMDVTDFKLFNDTYGHAVGDAVLRAVSDCLSRIFRISDVVGRYGGDEFVVLLPETDCGGAEIICARAVAAISNRPFAAPDGSQVSIRLTCGIASLPDDGYSADDLLQVADARLYMAKEQGKALIEAPCDANARVSQAVTLKPSWRVIGALDALITAIDHKDRYTRRHCERVWKYALLTAQELDCAPPMLEAVYISSLVLDIGKIVVSAPLLRKPGRFTEEEMEVIRQHPVIGAMIVKDIPQVETVLDGIRHHHESFDGSGYPDGLQGEAIPFIGRLLAAADCFTAMTVDRPYRTALSQEQALQEMTQLRGVKYDPMIMDALASAIEKAANSDADALAVLQSTIAQDK